MATHPIPACISRQEPYLQIRVDESAERNDRPVNKRLIFVAVDLENVLRDNSSG